MPPGQLAGISGLYEACIGTPDLVSQIQYWERFGYRVGEIGELEAATAQQLYRVNSGLQSVRLDHQSADHGLIRLMAWEQPVNDGLGLGTMKARGNRWITTLTADVLKLLNHAEQAAAAGWPIRYSQPYWEVIYSQNQPAHPFREPAVGVRELLLLQPLTRQVLFERFNYTLTHYGHIHTGSMFQTSQITHMGLIIQDDSRETLRFYEEVMGLLRVRDNDQTTYESSAAAREFFDLQPQESFFVTAFDDPRSSQTDWQAVRSGRLYILRFPEAIPLGVQFERSCPGCLGLSLYTYRVQDLETYHQKVQDSTATGITAIHHNEFGEPSFSFTAPDGYFWTVITERSQRAL